MTCLSKPSLAPASLQAAHLTMPLEKRFGKRLQRGSAEDAEAADLPANKKGRPMGKFQGMPDSTDTQHPM